MISWEQAKQKAKKRPGQFVDWNDEPYHKPNPRKRIDQCFIVEDVIWSFDVIDTVTGEIHSLETNNAQLERDFKKQHGERYRNI